MTNADRIRAMNNKWFDSFDWPRKETEDRVIGSSPTEHLVRCKECMWQRKQLLPNGHYWYQCINGNEGLGFDGDFCSNGERREDV